MGKRIYLHFAFCVFLVSLACCAFKTKPPEITDGKADKEKESPEILIVENFDYGEGDGFGTWNKDDADDTQGCINEFSSEIKFGASGRSLKLAYDIARVFNMAIEEVFILEE